MKLFLGCIYTVISISIATGIVFWFGDSSLMTRNEAMLVGAGYSAPVAAIFIIIWGLPTHFILRKYKKYTVQWYALSGFITGPLYAFIVRPFGNDEFLTTIGQATYFGLTGAVGAMVFWWFVVKNKNA